ncbi:MAG: hypothetical protein M1830_000323 [Pleopsidium flavum]|nr:MAG: hypothetical protein M1830_000323 [Pleopsidium flavum]
MTEVLALASGIAGLLNLTIEVYKISATYISGVHGASKAVQSLLRELKALRTVLLDLDELAAGINEDEVFGARLSSLRRVKDAKEYRDILREVQQKLTERIGGSKISIKIKSLTWPFSETKTEQIVAKLQRHLTIFQAALGVDTLVVGLETLKGVRDIEQQLKDEDAQKVLEWLSSSNMHQKQQDIYSRRQNNTGEWLLKEVTFVEWLTTDSSHPTLWCPGNPGSGKTVMSSIVVDHIQTISGSEVAIAFVYCDYQDQARQTASDLVATLVKQLAVRGPEQLQQVFNLHKHVENGQIPSLRQLETLLLSLCGNFARTFVIVDALDECTVLEERERFLSVLQSLEKASIKTLITSRPNLGDIKAQLRHAPQVEIIAKESDIRTYVKEKTESNRVFMKRLTPILEAQIIDAITDRARGMFLMAVLQLERIWRERTATKIMKALLSLPPDLTQIYQETLTRIKNQAEPDNLLGMRILQWISHAKRPLLVDELRHALAVEWDDDEGPPQSLDLDNILDPESLVDVCAGLVIVEEESQVIRLVHFTTEEFFRASRASLFPNADTQISKTCLTYLCFEIFRKKSYTSDEERDTRLRDFPFLGYAGFQWAFHLPPNPEEDLRDMMLKMLDDHLSWPTLVQVVDIRGLNNIVADAGVYYGLTGLHVAAYFGLDVLVSFLLEQRVDIEANDNDNKKPLHWAARGNRGTTTRLLLEKGANIEAKGAANMTALQLAAWSGHEAIVRLLMEKGAITDEQDAFGYTALHRAVWQKHEAITQLLLENGTDPKLKTQNGGTVLHTAAKTGHEAIT